MSTEADPYRQLLEIESDERPPNHYALLGLTPFESDSAVIDEAAGERMGKLQEYANSEHLDASQKLLNEVSAARRCLLNPTQKIAYDEELRSRQRRKSSGGNQRPRGSKKPPLMPVGIAVVVVTVLSLILIFLKGGPAPTGNLIVNWPMSERAGAVVLLDGSELPVPKTDPMYLQIPSGRHRVVFRRDGHEEIRRTHVFSDVKVKLKLNWVPKR